MTRRPLILLTLLAPLVCGCGEPIYTHTLLLNIPQGSALSPAIPPAPLTPESQPAEDVRLVFDLVAAEFGLKTSLDNRIAGRMFAQAFSKESGSLMLLAVEPLDPASQYKLRFSQFAAPYERPITRDVRRSLTRRLQARFGPASVRPAPSFDRNHRLKLADDTS